MVAGREVEAATTKSDTERKLTLWNAVKSNLCCIYAWIPVLAGFSSSVTSCMT
jgi:hypothetical protein